MRANVKRHAPLRPGQSPLLPGGFYRLASPGGRDDSNPGEPAFAPEPAEREDLPYRVELWNEAKTSVEQVLAVTANGSIGFAAYYAASREMPHRYITLRDKNRIVTRWNGPGH